MVKLSFISFFSITFIVSLFLLAIFSGGGWPLFFDVETIVFILGLPFFFLLTIFGRAFIHFIPASILIFFTKHPSGNEQFAKIATFGNRITYGTATIFIVINILKLLQGFQDPVSIGPHMAKILLGPLFAVLLADLFFTCACVSFKAKTNHFKAHLLPVSNVLLPLAFICFILMVFFILLLTMCSL